jgi:GNAT superfamily N-acetyltransferase
MSQDETASRMDIRPAAAEHTAGMAALMAESYGCAPGDECFTAAMFRHHQALFPEGQFVALEAETQRVLGFTASMRTRFDPLRPPRHTWWEAAGEGWLSRHVPDGDWMYGIESCVHPAYRGHGIGGRLMDARFAALRRLNLRGLVAGGAPIDYGRVADRMSIEAYVRAVQAGTLTDTNLSKQLHKGFQVAGFIPDYLSGDETTRGWGVLIVWLNPAYRAVRRLYPAGTARRPAPLAARA